MVEKECLLEVGKMEKLFGIKFSKKKESQYVNCGIWYLTSDNFI